MKPNPHRTLGARLFMFVVLNWWSPLLADAPLPDDAPQRAGHDERSTQHASAGPSRIVSEHTNRRSRSEPRFVRARAYLVTLLRKGYDSQLLDYWLDALKEDTIIKGMPGDLIVAFFGEPLERRSIDFKGARAEQWSIVRRPNQDEQITVSAGKVIHVGP